MALADIAHRWKRSLPYVEEMVRTYKFKRLVVITQYNRGGSLIDHVYFTRAQWPYGETNSKTLGPGVVATCLVSYKSDTGFRWSQRQKVYVPWDELKAFESKFPVKEDKAQNRFTHDDKHMPEELQIANEIYQSIKNTTRPKYGWKKRIASMIRDKYPTLSDEACERIATVVNPNKKGGAPRQN